MLSRATPVHRLRLLLVISTLSLAGCEFNAADRAYILLPNAAATRNSAMVGEPVEVKLTTAVDLPPDSSMSKKVISDLILGACFAGAYSEGTGALKDASGMCSTGDSALSQTLQVSAGDTHTENVGDIEVRRSERVLVEHKFTFTALEAGRVVIVPAVRFVEDSSKLDMFSGTAAEVTFR